MSTPTPSILFITSPELGSANIILATAYEVALAGANATIASVSQLRSNVDRIQDLVTRHAASRPNGKSVGSIRFVERKGSSHMDALKKCGVPPTKFPHPAGVLGALTAYSYVDTVLAPWSKEEYLETMDSCVSIIQDTKPDLVVIDIVLGSAMDACKLLGQKMTFLVASSYKEIILDAQPGLDPLLRYPATCSGFSFPLKWWEIPFSIYLTIRLIIRLVTSPRLKAIQEGRNSRGLSGAFFGNRPPGVKYILPALPGIDYPFRAIPKELVSCGPIVLPFDPVEQCDPELAKWLDNGPTVLVNLGSLVVSDASFTRELSTALRMLLEYHDRKGASGFQVIWKVKAEGDIQKPIDEVIGGEIKSGRMKVVPWLDAQPVGILQHPNLVCSVHHGGANSFYEGVWSGVPHVVLPVWFDTYDFATRAEYLGIGLWGSHTSAPRVDAEEFGKALIRVTGDTDEAASFRREAKRLQEVCRKHGSGREISCQTILSEAGR